MKQLSSLHKIQLTPGKAIFSAAVFFSVFLFSSDVSAATIEWIGNPDSLGSSWTNTANWSTGTVPTSADTVNITPAPTPTYEMLVLVWDGVNAAANQLNLNGSLARETTIDLKHGSSLTVDTLNIGKTGYGRLQVFGSTAETPLGASSLVTTGETQLGWTSGLGQVQVYSDSTWNATGKVSLGMQNGGLGAIGLYGDAVGTFANDVILGAVDYGTGYAAIIDSSKMTVQGNFIIGGAKSASDTQSRMTLRNTATLNTQGRTVLARDAGSVGSMLLYNNSKWNATTQVVVGAGGTGDVVLYNSAVATISKDMTLGQSAGSIGAFGTYNTSRLNTLDLVVGDAGQGITRFDGESIVNTTGSVVVGKTAASNHSNLSVLSTAYWYVSSTFTLGEKGTNATLYIANQGELETVGQAWIAKDAGSSATANVGATTNSLLAKWTASSIEVGVNGDGRLNIYNKGTVTTSAVSAVGTGAGGRGYVDIRGTGSKWNASADVNIGTGGRGRVVVRDAGTMDTNTFTITLGGASSWATNRGWLDVEAATLHAYTIAGTGTKTGKFNVLGHGSTINLDNGYNAGGNVGTYFYVDSSTAGTSIVNVGTKEGTQLNLGGTSYVSAYGMAMQRTNATFDIYNATSSTYTGTFTAPQVKVKSGGQSGTSGVMTVEFDFDGANKVPTWNLDQGRVYYVDPERIYMGWLKLEGTLTDDPLRAYFTYNDVAVSDSVYLAFVDYLNNGLADAGLGVTLYQRDSKGVEFNLIGSLLADSSLSVLGWGLDHFNDLHDVNISLQYLSNVPEPATWVMLLLGAAGLVAVRRRKSN